MAVIRFQCEVRERGDRRQFGETFCYLNNWIGRHWHDKQVTGWTFWRDNRWVDTDVQHHPSVEAARLAWDRPISETQFLSMLLEVLL